MISDSEHEESNQFDDDFFASDKQTSKPKKQVKKKNASEPESLEKTKSRAQLQLLLLDDDNKQTDLDFNAKEILKSQKPSHRKKKNVCEGLQESFEIDLKDERFRDIYKHDFFIDTTNPKFKKTENMEKIRRAVRDSNVVDGDVAGIVDGRRELDVLVESAKRKSMLALKEKSKKVKII